MRHFGIINFFSSIENIFARSQRTFSNLLATSNVDTSKLFNGNVINLFNIYI